MDEEAREPQPLARLTFNASAVREYFGDETKGVRLRIEQRLVTFHSVKIKRGADVLAIERRPRGVTLDVDPTELLARRLMQRLFKAGLTEEQPHFVLEPAARGWFSIDHLGDEPPPQRAAVMTVSDFEPPPLPVDMTLWRRFLRTISANKAVDEETWLDVRRMVLGAQQVMDRPQRGRASQARTLATQLTNGVARNAQKLLDWAEAQPEFTSQVVHLLKRIGVEIEGEPEAPEEAVEAAGGHEEPEVEQEVVEEPPPPRKRPARRKRAAKPKPESPGDGEPEPLADLWQDWGAEAGPREVAPDTVWVEEVEVTVEETTGEADPEDQTNQHEDDPQEGQHHEGDQDHDDEDQPPGTGEQPDTDHE